MNLLRMVLCISLLLVGIGCSKSDSDKTVWTGKSGKSMRGLVTPDDSPKMVNGGKGALEAETRGRPLPTQPDSTAQSPNMDEIEFQVDDAVTREDYDSYDDSMEPDDLYLQDPSDLSNVNSDFVGSISPEEEAQNMAAEQQFTGDIQRNLKQLGYDPGNIDGIMGPDTANALRLFQREHGLTESGQLDEETLNLLMQGEREDFEFAE